METNKWSYKCKVFPSEMQNLKNNVLTVGNTIIVQSRESASVGRGWHIFVLIKPIRAARIIGVKDWN